MKIINQFSSASGFLLSRLPSAIEKTISSGALSWVSSEHNITDVYLKSNVFVSRKFDFVLFCLRACFCFFLVFLVILNNTSQSALKQFRKRFSRRPVLNNLFGKWF